MVVRVTFFLRKWDFSVYKLKNTLRGAKKRDSKRTLENKIPPNCVSSLTCLPSGIFGEADPFLKVFFRTISRLSGAIAFPSSLLSLNILGLGLLALPRKLGRDAFVEAELATVRKSLIKSFDETWLKSLVFVLLG